MLLLASKSRLAEELTTATPDPMTSMPIAHAGDSSRFVQPGTLCRRHHSAPDYLAYAVFTHVTWTLALSPSLSAPPSLPLSPLSVCVPLSLSLSHVRALQGAHVHVSLMAAAVASLANQARLANLQPGPSPLCLESARILRQPAT